jgi:hypothetical protein
MVRSHLAAVTFALAALLAAAPVAAQAPVTLAIDAAGACGALPKSYSFDGNVFGLDLQDGCGPRGAIELARTGAPLLGAFDHWAIRGSANAHEIKQTSLGSDFVTKDRATIIDAEIGALLPWQGFFGSISRVTLGVRYADYGFEATQSPAGLSRRFESSGFGPRIGMRSTLPLWNGFAIESQNGLSAVFTRKDFRQGATVEKGNDTVFMYDSTTALSWSATEVGKGLTLSLGVHSNYAFDQLSTQALGDIRRFDWGPFARLRVPLQ